MTQTDKCLLMLRCQSAADLRQWLQTYLHLTFPDDGLCPGHVSPFEYIRAAYFEPARDLVVWAPRGGGKTRLGAAATLLDLLHKPGVAVRILGGSLEQSLRMWEHLLPDIERLADTHVVGRITAKRVTLANRSSAGVVTQSQRAVRGLRVQKLRCDEVEMFDPKVWEAAQMVTRKQVAGPDEPWPEIAGVVEAVSTHHQPAGLMGSVIERAREKGITLIQWCLMDVLEQCPPERPCETCALLVECGGRLKGRTGGYMAIDDAIRIKDRVSIETWEAEMLCLRPSDKGRVYPSFHEATHVITELPAGLDAADLYLGIDFGFSNPFACLWIRRDAQGRSFVIDEYVQAGRTIHQHIDEIAARGHGPVRIVCCDPAGNGRSDQTGKSDIDALRKAGFHVRSRCSRIVDGLEQVRAALRTGTGRVSLHVHPRCRGLIAALKAYRYPEKGGELPLKDEEHDHVVDALRYYFISRDSGRMEGRWY